MRLFIQMAWRSLAGHRQRNVTIFLAVFMSVLLLHIYAGFLKGYMSAFNERAFEADGHVSLYQEGYYDRQILMPQYLFIPNPDELELKLRSDDRVRSVRRELPFASVISFQENSFPVMGLSVPDSSQLPGLVKSSFSALPAWEGRDELMLGAGLAAFLGVSVGDKVVLMGQDVMEAMSLRSARVVGVFQTHVTQLDHQVIFVPLSLAQSLLGLGDGVTKISVFLQDEAMSGPVIETASSYLESIDVQAFPWQVTHPEIMQLRGMNRVSRGILSGVILLVTGVSIINVILLALMDRVREFGTLRALGFSRRQLSGLVMLEVSFVGGIASLFGVILAGSFCYYYSIYGINMGAAMDQLQGMSRVIYTVFEWRDVFLYFVLGVLAVLLGCLYPLRVIFKVSVMEALRYR